MNRSILSLLSFLLCASSSLAQIVQSFAPVPPEGQIYLGAWTDISDGFSQTPAAINNLLGLNFPIFQFAQSIPLPPYDYVTGAGGQALFSQVDQTATNAAFFLTVYPDQNGGLSAVQDSDLVSLAQQIGQYEASGRTVYLRFAPEMGGSWMVYGLQPTAFVALWQRMYAIVKQIAPLTVIVWSPNSSYGYPSGVTLSQVASAADRSALDTNNDGQLTAADDAFSPYYPGDAFVDWAGVSLYYKGPGFQNINEAQPGGFCAKLLIGEDPFYEANYTDFYDTYCRIANRPCIMSETGAAYHTNITGGATQVEIQQAWWSDCLTNTTFFDLFPQIRSIFMFEHAKYEFDGGVEDFRDYRIMNDSSTIAGFSAAVRLLGDRFAWANSTRTGGISADPALATSMGPSPAAITTATQTVTISQLTNEVIEYTSTGFSTPAAPDGTYTVGGGLSISAVNPGINQAAVLSSSASTYNLSLSLFAFTLIITFFAR